MSAPKSERVRILQSHGFKGINRDTYKVREYDVENYPQNWGMWFIHRFNSPGLEDKTWKAVSAEAGRPATSTPAAAPTARTR